MEPDDLPESVFVTVGVVQEPTREVGARGARDAVGSCAEVLGEEAPKMPCGHAQSSRQIRLPAAVEHAGEDQSDSAADQLGAGRPGR